MQAMYAQMVYKDRKIMELNNKVLEQDRKVMDLQELAGEKQEVIRGRDKVVEVSINCAWHLRLQNHAHLIVCPEWIHVLQKLASLCRE